MTKHSFIRILTACGSGLFMRLWEWGVLYIMQIRELS